jgi:hypothetical protein
MRWICEKCGLYSNEQRRCTNCGSEILEDENIPSFKAPPLSESSYSVGTKSMEVFLDSFLRNGTLGQLYVGQKQSEALNCFGVPAEFHRGTNIIGAEIWINGIVTIFFEETCIARIGLYFILSYEKNNNIELKDYFPEKKTKIAEIIRYLEAKKISYVISPQTTSTFLVTSCGTQIIFSGDNLCSIVFPKTRDVVMS